jgi:hypothetical protein
MERVERQSSGGAGGGKQPAPDKASWKRCYPARTCNELLGDALEATN